VKCKVCKGPAVIRLRSHNLALCESCFLDFFYRQVSRTIKRYRLFDKGDKILVGVSGGKDSLALLDALITMGYNAVGVFIDLEMGYHSVESKEKVEKIAKERDYPVIIRSISDYLGVSLPVAAQEVKRPVCSLCGMIKRYILNRIAMDEGFSVLATGHNLDDECARLLGNILDWRVDFLARQDPLLDEEEGLVRKVKPLARTSERELTAYCIIRGIDYVQGRCPYANKPTSYFYKGIMFQIERKMPGTKLRFYQGFVEFKREYLTACSNTEKQELTRCERCGYPTLSNVCNFCRVKERIEQRRDE